MLFGIADLQTGRMDIFFKTLRVLSLDLHIS